MALAHEIEIPDASPPARPDALLTQSAVFRREGEYWSIEFERDEFRVRDSRGMRHLARLLQAPGGEVHALELAAPPAAIVERRTLLDPDVAMAGSEGAGPSLDAEAKAAYRARLRRPARGARRGPELARPRARRAARGRTGCARPRARRGSGDRGSRSSERLAVRAGADQRDPGDPGGHGSHRRPEPGARCPPRGHHQNGDDIAPTSRIRACRSRGGSDLRYRRSGSGIDGSSPRQSEISSVDSRPK